MDEIHNSKIENSLVSVVILNYNDVNYIEKCLDSVFRTTGCKFEVILIDNGSTDGSSLACKEKFPQIRLFQNKENFSHTKAMLSPTVCQHLYCVLSIFLS